MSEKSAKGNALQRGERLQLMLDAVELKALDDCRYTHRMPSRAAAIRELLRRGLTDLSVSEDITNTRSQDFGVINSPSMPSGSDEKA